MTPTAAGARRAAVLLLDAESRAVVAGWWLRAACDLPVITKAFSIRVAVGTVAYKRLPYANEWQAARTFHVLSSNPALVRVRGNADGEAAAPGLGRASSELTVPGLGRAMLRLTVGPVYAVGYTEVLLFVNNSAGQNEESLLLQITVS